LHLQVVSGHCLNCGVAVAAGEAFLRELHAQWGALTSSVARAAQKLWTSHKRFVPTYGAPGIEFCALWGDVIRRDQASLAHASAVIARALNQNLVSSPAEEQARATALGPAAFPPQPRCWRGGGFGSPLPGAGALSPARLREFFDARAADGEPYRCMQFLATSFAEATADDFVGFAYAAGGGAMELVKWRVELDGRGEAQREFRCKHVNLVTEGHEDHEKEYLFSAFSVFTVRSCAWSATPTRPDTPHVVTLAAALDNKEFPTEPAEEDLVLAPWC
jgi:hypothetical protein